MLFYRSDDARLEWIDPDRVRMHPEDKTLHLRTPLALGYGHQHARFVNADSVAYLSLEALHEAAGDAPGSSRRFCNACFTGDYSVPVSPGTTSQLP